MTERLLAGGKGVTGTVLCLRGVEYTLGESTALRITWLIDSMIVSYGTYYLGTVKLPVVPGYSWQADWQASSTIQVHSYSNLPTTIDSTSVAEAAIKTSAIARTACTWTTEINCPWLAMLVLPPHRPPPLYDHSRCRSPGATRDESSLHKDHPTTRSYAQPHAIAATHLSIAPPHVPPHPRPAPRQRHVAGACGRTNACPSAGFLSTACGRPDDACALPCFVLMRVPAPP